MQLRQAEMKDVEKLIKLRLDFFALVGDQLSLDEQNKLNQALRNYYFSNLGKTFFAFLVEDKEEIAATAFMLLVDRPPSPAVPNGRTAQVLNVMTYPAYRRLGLANRLITHLIEEARRLNASRIDLSATADGEKVYRQLGFTEQSKHTFLQLSLIGPDNEHLA